MPLQCKIHFEPAVAVCQHCGAPLCNPARVEPGAARRILNAGRIDQAGYACGYSLEDKELAEDEPEKQSPTAPSRRKPRSLPRLRFRRGSQAPAQLEPEPEPSPEPEESAEEAGVPRAGRDSYHCERCFERYHPKEYRTASAQVERIRSG